MYTLVAKPKATEGLHTRAKEWKLKAMSDSSCNIISDTEYSDTNWTNMVSYIHFTLNMAAT